jgi:hypothetical protein
MAKHMVFGTGDDRIGGGGPRVFVPFFLHFAFIGTAF